MDSRQSNESRPILPEYLSTIPSAVPDGRVVVHSHVRPTRRLGARGFRAWLAEPSDRFAVCGCEWAPELGAHYRVARRHGDTPSPMVAPSSHLDLNRLFDEYNRQYWRGRLPKTRVRRRTALPDGDLGLCYGTSIDICRQTPDVERLTLLHEMCHLGRARGFKHGPLFQRKLRRLVRMGAPSGLLQDVERYDGTEAARRWQAARASGATFHAVPFRKAVLSDLDSIAEARYQARWSTVRQALAGQYCLTPARFDRVAPWAAAEWRRLRREAYREQASARALSRTLSRTVRLDHRGLGAG